MYNTESNMPLRTAIYLRRSSKDKDEKQIHSIPRQRRDVETFVQRHNAVHPPHERLSFTEEDVYWEDASGRDVEEEKRPRFHAMVKAVRKKKYDVLLCTDLSRLSRNAIDSGRLVQLLEASDDGDKKPYLMCIRTIDKVFEATPTDKFTLALFLFVAKFENDQRAVNTASGMDRQKSLGVTTHRAPLGYRNIGDKKGQKEVEKDANWDDVRELWNLMMTGDYSPADIKREADEMEIKHVWKRKEEYPSESTYRGMFRNRYYTGKVKRFDKATGAIKWEQGQHPPMVDDAEFEKVQLILQSQGFKHQHIEKSLAIQDILDEVLICGKCKTEKNGVLKPTKMLYEEKVRYTCANCQHRFASAGKNPCPKCETPINDETKIDVHRMYRCSKKHSSKSCSHDFYGDGEPKKNLKAEVIESYFDKQISKLYISDGLFDVLKKQLYTLWEKENTSLSNQKKEKMKKIENLEDKRLEMRKKVLLEEKKMTDAEKDDAETLMQMNQQEQDGIQQEINELTEKIEEKFEKAWQSLQALHDAKSVFATPQIGIEPKRKVVLSMVSNLKITDDDWEIIWKKPFDVVAKASIAKRGRPKSGTGSQGDDLNWLPRSGSNRQPTR